MSSTTSCPPKQLLGHDNPHAATPLTLGFVNGLEIPVFKSDHFKPCRFDCQSILALSFASFSKGFTYCGRNEKSFRLTDMVKYYSELWESGSLKEFSVMLQGSSTTGLYIPDILSWNTCLKYADKVFSKCLHRKQGTKNTWINIVFTTYIFRRFAKALAIEDLPVDSVLDYVTKKCWLQVLVLAPAASFKFFYTCYTDFKI